MTDTAAGERDLELAGEALAQFDREAVVAHLSAAVRAFTAAGEVRRAAMACVQLGDTLANLLGNLTAGRAWFARATRLVEGEPSCIEQGWVAVAAMGCDVDDPVVLLKRAELALDRARQFSDLNLETKALADGGLALVQVGRVAEGMAMLDEAMALACGPADDAGAAAKSVCSFFTACYFAADFGRAGSWTDLLRAQGLIGERVPGPVFLSSHCDSVQATLLMELGRWTEAEGVLEKAIHTFETAMGAPAWHPAIALADLRIRQGRFAEAEVLLLGKDQSMQALLPATRLHLERGDHDLAISAAQRGLRSIGTDRLRAVELLTLLIDAHLGVGDLDAALVTCDALRTLADEIAVPTLLARARAARSRLQVATGDPSGAMTTIEAALDALDGPSELPWLRATLLLDLARLHDAAGADSPARRAAVEAGAILAKLDVVLPPSGSALIGRLDSGWKGQPPLARHATLTRDGGWWDASHGDTKVRLRNSKGMQYLAALIEASGAERHALDLVDRVEGVGRGEPDRHRLGDAGELLDAEARAAYRHRIEALRGDIEEALDEDRLESAEALQDELDALVAQLTQAFGLGGRSRVAGSAAERARLNVTRALRTALTNLADALPAAGAALDRSVRTGQYCIYDPTGDEVRWIVQS